MFANIFSVYWEIPFDPVLSTELKVSSHGGISAKAKAVCDFKVDTLGFKDETEAISSTINYSLFIVCKMCQSHLFTQNSY